MFVYQLFIPFARVAILTCEEVSDKITLLVFQMEIQNSVNIQVNGDDEGADDY